MKGLGWTAAVLAMFFALAGCVAGGGDGGPPLIVEDVLSDPAVDGDIDSGGFVRVGAGTVRAGVDAGGEEFRGFLSFPLGNLPVDADVRYASLEVFVFDLAPLRTTPFTLDLVSFTPPLLSSDFDRTQLPYLVTRNFDVFSSDPGTVVRIDVTFLVREAFRRGLPDAQFRLLLDLNATEGLLTLADPVSSAATAPVLHVEYF